MRLYGIDILRGIAAFGIVGCHLLTEPRTAAGSAILHFCGMNVAVFAVLAGYFTHILPEGLGASLRHRLGRLVPIYVLWTLVFLFVQFILKMVHHEGLAQYGQIGFWISVVFKGYGSGGYLWFIIALIYTQVMALFILRKPVSIVVPLMLAASGIGLSILMPYWNGHGHFMFRLFGFVWLGIALRRVSYGTWRLYALFALILHVALQSWVHPTLRDLLVSVPLCLFAARLPTCFATPRISAVARFLGKTSLGVYLMHPLTARLGNVLLEHVFAAPYGPGVVLLDWLLAWVGALGLAAVFCSIPSTRRFVQ